MDFDYVTNSEITMGRAQIFDKMVKYTFYILHFICRNDLMNECSQFLEMNVNVRPICILGFLLRATFGTLALERTLFKIEIRRN